MKLKLYFTSLILFVAIDALCLVFVAPGFYRPQIGHLMAEQPNLIVAGIFYLLFIAGLQVFVIEPGLQNPSLQNAVLRGAFFGLVTYATYDLTNLATLKGWTPWLTAADLFWGTSLCAVVTFITIWVETRGKST